MENVMQLALMMANGLLTLLVTYAGWQLKKHQAAEAERIKKETARDKLQIATSRCILIRECGHYIKKGLSAESCG